MMSCLLQLCVALLCAHSASALVNFFDRPTCLSGIQLDSSTNRCPCPAGQKGDGGLCCVPEDEDLCTAKGDPVLTTISGQKFWLDFPCAQQLGTVAGLCKVTVLQAGKVVDKGAIYNNQFILRVETKLAWGPRVMVRDIKISGSVVFNPLLNLNVNILQLGGVLKLTLDGNVVNLLFDQLSKIWTVSLCGTQVILRGLQGLDAIQSKVPGVCISGPQGSFQDSFCNKDASYDKGNFRTPSERLLSDLILQRADIGDSGIEEPAQKPVCTDIARYYKQCNNYSAAIAACGNLLLVTIERRCLSVKLSNPLFLFKDCIAAFCGRDRAACDRLKADIGIQVCFNSAAQQCDTWVNVNVGVYTK